MFLSSPHLQLRALGATSLSSSPVSPHLRLPLRSPLLREFRQLAMQPLQLRPLQGKILESENPEIEYEEIEFLKMTDYEEFLKMMTH